MLTLKRVPAAVATVSIGYGIAKYKQTQAGMQSAQSQQQQQAESSRQAEADIMMAAYGDRSSLAELEAAMKAYEQQRPQR
ncbi:hypothetical protein G7054_g2622 [Neopestalotiopsis clavispora]|nr:hypothetical protein E8E14_001555 [Neopestalotiopsis sp. 37M]KAF7538862.1 hypothetical protein G7054_g2622 [Neopestalotiopsis clavispora]